MSGYDQKIYSKLIQKSKNRIIGRKASGYDVLSFMPDIMNGRNGFHSHLINEITLTNVGCDLIKEILSEYKRKYGEGYVTETWISGDSVEVNGIEYTVFADLHDSNYFPIHAIPELLEKNLVGNMHEYLRFRIPCYVDKSKTGEIFTLLMNSNSKQMEFIKIIDLNLHSDSQALGFIISDLCVSNNYVKTNINLEVLFNPLRSGEIMVLRVPELEFVLDCRKILKGMNLTQ